MERIQIAIVGCGGMGGRHLLGLKELYESDMCNVELVAACDLNVDNAENLANNAEELLGKRPAVFGDMAEMAKALPDLRAVDIATDAGSHHIVACMAMELGFDVLCEKPMGITMRAANRILATQERTGKVLSVAENYRRDPMSRLTKALLDAGAIGQPYMFFDISAGAGNNIVITPWRHLKHMGGMLLDGGVHNADMMLYYMGEPTSLYAKIELWEKTRYKPQGGGGPGGFYERWFKDMPESIEATAEDTLMSVMTFENGAMGQWSQSYAGHGKGYGHKGIYGSKGSMIPGGTRNGVSPVIKLDGQDEITGDPLLEFVPDFELDDITAHLFGGERMASYDMPFPSADRKLLAIEYYEFADSVIKGTTPEVDGLVGRRALAICYGCFESSVAGRAVTLAEIEDESLAAYEEDVNAHWKI